MFANTLYKRLIASHLLGVWFLSALLGIGGLSVTQAAHAQAGLVTCTGEHSASWTPGLTNTLQNITVSTTSTWNCTQALPISIGGITATSTNTFPAQLQCSSLLTPVPTTTWQISWNDHETSTYQFSSTANTVAGNLVVSTNGTIISGRYAGYTGIGTFTLLNLQGALDNLCDTAGGVTGASGLTTLTLLKLL